MSSKKKLLYITDQQEYTDHGTIGPLFNGYLKEYFDVHIVYFTKYKNSFQEKGTDYVVPQQYKEEICKYLDAKGVNLSSFDFIFVRNMIEILSDVLKNRQEYGYKVGFRVSFPKTEEAYETSKANNSSTVLGRLNSYYKKHNKTKLLAECDVFMPTSKDMEDAFYADSGVRSFPLPSGLDPARITPHRKSDGDERHFIYVGTLDSLRQFEQVLIAFTKVNSNNWHLNISTRNLQFAKTIMEKYTKISDKVSIIKADNLDELMKQVDDCDVGISLLPDIPIYNTAIPAKVMDYYTCAIPALLTHNAKNRTLFSDEDALFCNFKVENIVKKLEEIIEMSQKEIATMGEMGQKKLLSHKRNYKIMAKELYEELESI